MYIETSRLFLTVEFQLINGSGIIKFGKAVMYKYHSDNFLFKHQHWMLKLVSKSMVRNRIFT